MKSLNREVNDALIFLTRHGFKIKLIDGGYKESQVIIVSKLIFPSRGETPRNGAYRVINNDPSIERTTVATQLKQAAESIKIELKQRARQSLYNLGHGTH